MLAGAEPADGIERLIAMDSFARAALRPSARVALAGVMLVAGLAGAVAATDPVDPTDSVDGAGPVFVDSTRILYLESFPVQAVLVVTGDLPTPCHEPAFEVQDFGRSIDVRMWSVADPEVICADVLEPFEVTIPLGSWASADVPVVLDGEQVGTIEIAAGGSAAVELAGAGWSFGFCAGFCRADLTIDGGRLSFAGSSNIVSDPMWTNLGTLTSEGARQLEDALMGVDPAGLEAIYGCPDCADGGAAWVELRDGARSTRHEMPFGGPPDELAPLYAVSMALLASLEACTSNELVEVDGTCRPYEQG